MESKAFGPLGTLSVQLFSDGHFVSPCISIFGCILKILLRQPCGFLVILRDIDALDLEDDRPCAVVAAGDHHAVVVGPSLHDRTAL